MRYLGVLIGFLLFTHLSAQEKDSLRVAYTNAPPFIIVDSNHIDGINVFLWKQCAKEMNLPYKMFPMPSFGDMLDSLRAGAIDISINPLTITSERMKTMLFTQSYYASHSIIVKQSIKNHQKLQRFIASLFSFRFLSAFLLLMGIILLFGVLVWFFEHRVNPQHFRKGLPGLWDGLWWSVVTMTTVGYGDKAPKSSGGKVVALIWMFSGLLFISGITASVASSLTLDSLSSDTRDLKDFYQKKMGTIQHSSSENCLDENGISNIIPFSDVTKGLEALYDNEIDAFFYDEPILKYRIGSQSRFRVLEILPGKYKTQFYGFGLSPANDSLTHQLSQTIIQLTEGREWQERLEKHGLE